MDVEEQGGFGQEIRSKRLKADAVGFFRSILPTDVLNERMNVISFTARHFGVFCVSTRAITNVSLRLVILNKLSLSRIIDWRSTLLHISASCIHDWLTV